ncbi:MAG TPA: hypothetical protein PLX35_08355 [Cyclobacteriaceae bacterium]|nr:hypothetical protein [Cyclobacteriaceae bacterium]
MTKTFTQNDLIRFIYQETTEEEAREINRVLTFDRELQLLYRELMLTKTDLDKARLEPSASTVANILNYARGLEVKH